MAQSPEPPISGPATSQYVGVGIALGAGAGGAQVTEMGNIAGGVAVGIAVGAALGIAWGQTERFRSDEPSGDWPSFTL